MYSSRQYLSIDLKKYCHVPSNADISETMGFHI